ncbi:phage holin family protein [uncultured Subdoligranulum sp.]|uniref:phage holin family protein n=1 Tax=uncultured Subdoligranulum sp. TaxID=512298 RepID=UPI00261BD7A2|nr:phage holin family protein [uncultured Subdoligranulum sp.]
MENENVFLVLKAAVVAAASAFSAAFGWMGLLFLAWVGCMAMDWISGSAAAAAKGKWSSAVARAGVWHKAGMTIVVMVAFVTDKVVSVSLANMEWLPFDYEFLVSPVILVWYIFTELGSIAENAVEMGAPIPAWLPKMLEAGKDAADKLGGTK